MKVTVINGSMRHGSTWHCKEEFLKALGEYDNVSVTQFSLPKYMPSFCRGCFNCFMKGEGKCPDAQYISPIVKSMEESDIAITSPVYALAVSGQLKALLDHLCFMWASHRPNLKMLDNDGGNGRGCPVKTIKKQHELLGIKEDIRA